jgi:hypothetical protein
LTIAASLLVASATARRPDNQHSPRKRDIEVHTNASDLSPSAAATLRSGFAAQLDTFVLGEWDFGTTGLPSKQGWTSVDKTAATGTYFHVASAAELDGGDYGGLVVLEGSKSLWCGAAADAADPVVCTYNALPGYGSNWGQNFTSVPLARSGDVTLSYIIRWDSEPYYDRTTVYYSNADGEWTNAGVGREGRDFYDSDGFARESVTIPDIAMGDSVRIRFRFTSDGAWDDQDGLWDTDGAVIIDILVVGDGSGVIDFQDFEAESDGALATNDGRWLAEPDEGYGDFADVFYAAEQVQEDPCVSRIFGVWAFFNGSTDDYSCGGYPNQPAVPHERTVERTPWTSEIYLANEIWSPVLDWTRDIHGNTIPASASSALLEFDVYRDLPISGLVFYTWNARRIDGACPAEWPYIGVNLAYGNQKDWYRHRAEIALHVAGGATNIQVMLGAKDMCAWWCGVYGNGECHSHAPLFDNVRVVRVDLKGPAWNVFEGDMFQDNFAADGTTTGVVRIDRAKKHLVTEGRADSAYVIVVAPELGIDYHIPGDANSGPAVYAHVKDVSPSKSSGALTDDHDRWPVVGSAGGWTVIRCDYVRDAYNPESIVADFYCIDLNDNLFTPGDTIWYHFSARDANGNTNYYSTLTGVTDNINDVRTWPMEVTCLPANAANGATDILYVDNFDNRGAQPLFESAFEMLGLTPDRYDVLASSSILGNSPGGRVVDVAQQLIAPYRKIIWNSGNRRYGSIGDGSNSTPRTANDFAVLLEYLDQSPAPAGLYVSGDKVAAGWAALPGAEAIALRSTYMDFAMVRDGHIYAGEPLSPLVIGAGGGMFDHAGEPDTMVAYGGRCTVTASFDIMRSRGAPVVEMSYSGNPAHGAVLSQITPNAAGDTARVVLSGFSYHRIRNDRTQTPVDRADHLYDILLWLQNAVGPPTATGDHPAYAFSLSQNRPNPFNPATTIEYTVARRGRVSLRVYDVAGRLARTLVDDDKDAGVHRATWDGRNDGGGRVASGVYFYRLASGRKVITKKMVLLK